MKKRKNLQKALVIALFMSNLIVGCAFTDRVGQTSFEPIEGDGAKKSFKYYAKSTGYTPAYSDSAEELRIKWLNDWLSDNNYCPKGYQITSRKEVDLGISSAVKNIYYTGICK